MQVNCASAAKPSELEEIIPFSQIEQLSDDSIHCIVHASQLVAYSSVVWQAADK